MVEVCNMLWYFIHILDLLSWVNLAQFLTGKSTTTMGPCWQWVVWFFTGGWGRNQKISNVILHGATISKMSYRKRSWPAKLFSPFVLMEPFPPGWHQGHFQVWIQSLNDLTVQKFVDNLTRLQASWVVGWPVGALRWCLVRQHVFFVELKDLEGGFLEWGYPKMFGLW